MTVMPELGGGRSPRQKAGRGPAAPPYNPNARLALTPGTRLGVYEITALIGVGGMGEVYQARDTRLNRDVAIKVLPDSFAATPIDLRGFTREAKFLAALNHPNIAQIHGLEKVQRMHALVMELVEGDDLSQRIARGAIPLDEALPIAKQIAERSKRRTSRASSIAISSPRISRCGRRHGEGARLRVGESDGGGRRGSSPSMSQSPTITSPAMTQAGMILGTAAYMCPEQARGKTVDKRADIWAFGAVLFEMLTGQRAFPGDDVTDTLVAVVRAEPEWDAVAADATRHESSSAPRVPAEGSEAAGRRPSATCAWRWRARSRRPRRRRW